MKMLVYTVFDRAVGAFLQPFFVRAPGEALRSFVDAVNDPKSQFYNHLLDYTLCKVGEFDDNSGMFVAVEPERVLSAVEAYSKPTVDEEKDAPKVVPRAVL